MSRAGHPALRALLALGLAAVAPVLAAPAVSAHQAGDLPTNTRGVQVETEGEGMAMEFVANLQYNDSGEAQNGSDIEFMRLGKKEYALAGTLREGLQIIDITTPRKPKRVAVYDCAISQGDIQVWARRGRVLASYTADGTVGAAGAASRCGRDLELSAGDAGTVIVVSHDRAFVDNVVTRTLAFEGGGRVGDYVGGYEDWLRQRVSPKPRPAKSSAQSGAAKKPAAGPKRSYKVQKELDELPARIETLERRQAELAQELVAALFDSDPRARARIMGIRKAS